MGAPADTRFFCEVALGMTVDTPVMGTEFVCEITVSLVYLPPLVAARESCLSGDDNLPGPPLSRKNRVF